MCCRSYRDVRTNDSLDQTRTGTIVCSETTTFASIHAAFVEQQWSLVFSGNRTRLKIIGIESVPRYLFSNDLQRSSTDYILPNVSRLDVSVNSLSDNRSVKNIDNVLEVLHMVPNLKVIDLSHLRVIRPTITLNDVFKTCLNLRGIVWKGSFEQMPLDGIRFRLTSRPLTELNLDSSILGTSLILAEDIFSTAHCVRQDTPNHYMFMRFPHLQRLSIKNCSWAYYGEDFSSVVSQEMIMKMVREHSSLRWLKSDLTKENIARMKRERPDITFVSE